MNDSQRILDCIRRLVRYIRINDRASQTQVGLSGAQLFVLHELGRTPSLSLSDLAQRTMTDQSSVSVVVTRLVEGGYVARDRDATDARRLVLTLTKNGRAVVQRSPTPPQEGVLAAIERIPLADRKRFADLFSRLIDELGEAGGTVPMMEFEESAAKRTKNQD